MFKKNIFKIVFLFPICLLINVFLNAADNDKRAPVTLEAFVSPYQRQSINLETMLNSIRLRFEDKIRIKVSFSIDYDEDKDAFSSAGGENEISETFRQAYIYNNYPENFWIYLIARNQDVYNAEWLSYAGFAGLDAKQIDDVSGNANNDAVKEILKQDSRQIRQKMINDFPALFINSRQITDISNLPKIASYINNLLPPDERVSGIGISDYDEPSKIDVIAVVNLYGFGGDVFTFNNAFPEIAKNAEIQTVGYQDQYGQDLIKKYKLDFLPSFLVKKSRKGGRQRQAEPLENSDTDLFISKRLFLDRGDDYDYYIVPSTVIGYGMYLSRPPIDNKLEVFVMSFCPWGAQTLLKLSETAESSPGLKVPIKFHYIVDATTQNPKNLSDFSSLHGLPEVEEDVRQLVIQKYFPDKFTDYIRQRTKNMESTVNIYKAFKAAGIDEKVVTEKMEKEGVGLLVDETALSKQFNIIGSPSFLWQNKYILDVESFNTIPQFRNLIALRGSCKK